MNLHRFYCKVITDPIVELTGKQVHHLATVCRLTKGDKVELFDGAGSLAEAIVTNVKPSIISLKVEQINVHQKPHPAIVLAVSIAKGQRFDWLITKCTELGVSRICPVIFQRTVKQPKNPNAAQRWQRLAIEAAKQCRRLFLPRLDNPSPLQDTLNILAKDHPNAKILFGSLDQKACPLVAEEFSSDIIAVVGPEGGFTHDETSLLQSSGALPVRLTDTVLRVETAALAFAVILTAKRDVS